MRCRWTWTGCVRTAGGWTTGRRTSCCGGRHGPCRYGAHGVVHCVLACTSRLLGWTVSGVDAVAVQGLRGRQLTRVTQDCTGGLSCGQLQELRGDCVRAGCVRADKALYKGTATKGACLRVLKRCSLRTHNANGARTAPRRLQTASFVTASSIPGIAPFAVTCRCLACVTSCYPSPFPCCPREGP